MTRRREALLGTGATGRTGNASDVVGTTRQKTVLWIIGGRNVCWDAACFIKRKTVPEGNLGMPGSLGNQTLHPKWLISAIDHQEGAPPASQETKREIDSEK